MFVDSVTVSGVKSVDSSLCLVYAYIPGGMCITLKSIMHNLAHAY